MLVSATLITLTIFLWRSNADGEQADLSLELDPGGFQIDIFVDGVKRLVMAVA